MAEAEWIDNLKQIALKAVEAGDPCDILPGTVLTASPPSVQIGQKTTVAGGQLLVPQHLTDYQVPMVIPELGTVTVTVNNALKVGDKVLLVQKRGGQQYLVIDRW